MKMKIAAFVDQEGNALPINARGSVHIYEIRDANWLCIEQVPFGIEEGMSVTDIRHNIHRIAPSLEGCIALIVHHSKGICNTIFEEELHMRIFLATGNPLAVLFQVRDIIRKQIIQAIENVEQRKTVSDLIVPVVVGEQITGCFQIDLVKWEEKDRSFDSEEIILPFLRTKKFLELEIVCHARPQWLDRALADLNFESNTEFRKDGLCHAFVRPRHKAM